MNSVRRFRANEASSLLSVSRSVSPTALEDNLAGLIPDWTR
jgi:hypothetical protein